MNNNSHDGPISLGLLSLQAQVKTLLEEAGGNSVVELLDALCKIHPEEQHAVLTLFTRVIDRIATGHIRLSEEQSELQAFEEALYEDLLASLKEIEREKSPLKLEVLKGGKCKSGAVVHIDELRRARKIGKRPVLN